MSKFFLFVFSHLSPSSLSWSHSLCLSHSLSLFTLYHSLSVSLTLSIFLSLYHSLLVISLSLCTLSHSHSLSFMLSLSSLFLSLSLSLSHTLTVTFLSLSLFLSISLSLSSLYPFLSLFLSDILLLSPSYFCSSLTLTLFLPLSLCIYLILSPFLLPSSSSFFSFHLFLQCVGSGCSDEVPSSAFAMWARQSAMYVRTAKVQSDTNIEGWEYTIFHFFFNNYNRTFLFFSWLSSISIYSIFFSSIWYKFSLVRFYLFVIFVCRFLILFFSYIFAFSLKYSLVSFINFISLLFNIL